jgi:uncharacterized ferredoxin-like protein
MSDTPVKYIANVSTGETQIVPLTAEEIAQREADVKAAQEAQAQRDADAAITAGLKASAKAKLIAGQPLTEAEAATIVL